MTVAEPETDIDWSLTTREGARREQLRRWAELPLERIILALEEMAELAKEFGSKRSVGIESRAGNFPGKSQNGLTKE